MKIDLSWVKERLLEPSVLSIADFYQEDYQAVFSIIDMAKRKGLGESTTPEIDKSYENIRVAVDGLITIYRGGVNLSHIYGRNAPSLSKFRRKVDKMIEDIMLNHYPDYCQKQFIEAFKAYAIKQYSATNLFLMKQQLKMLVRCLGVLQKKIYISDASTNTRHLYRGNFSNLNFSGVKFNNNCFNGMYFKQSNFSNSVFEGDGTTATCLHANFEDADLTNFVFSGGYEKGCCIKSSCFDRACLHGANLTGISNWEESSFIEADLTEAFIIKEGVKITGEALREHLIKKVGKEALYCSSFVDSDFEQNCIALVKEKFRSAKNKYLLSSQINVALLPKEKKKRIPRSENDFQSLGACFI